MEKSNFQFTTPILKRIDFTVNDDFERGRPLNLGIKIKVNVSRNDEANEPNSAVVSVTVCVGTKDNSAPFYIEAEESAKFRWLENAFDEKQTDDLLNQNAVALLISYLRPIISNVTSASPYPAYNLPYIDLTSIER